jgi:hypothetical protein
VDRGLEGLLTSSSTFYASDATKPMLLLADGAYLEDQARADHLGGDQWGMMNETGNYPGQPWMWLYTFLVSDQTVLHIGQRRRPGLESNGGAHPRTRPAALHPRPAIPTPTPRGAPPHLARPCIGNTTSVLSV